MYNICIRLDVESLLRSNLEAFMYVANSKYPAAVKQVRKIEVYRQVLWGLAVLDCITAMFFLAFPMVSDAPRSKWMVGVSLAQLGASVVLLGLLLAAIRVVKAYVKSGKVVRAEPAVIDAYNKLLRETNTHWSLDTLFDRQQQHDVLSKRMDADYKEKLRVAREMKCANDQASTWD